MSRPSRLGKYEITEVLGEGAMGVVYKAFDPDIRRVVALKTIRLGLDDGSLNGLSVAARFRNEAQAAGRLMHPGIVSVYEFGQDAHVAFIAMEFVEGRSLAHYLADKLRFTDEDIPGVMCQVLEALEHAHDRGVWHRDIKPANIIMSTNGRLKVADFGIARIEDAGLTQTSLMIGTPTYMAPEQFLGTPMDRRVDVYAAGVLLYILLTGRPPFTGSQDQLMYKVVHEVPPAPSALEGVQRPHFYDAIVARALAKNPEQRFPTAAAFRQAIESGVGEPFDTTVWERTVVAAPRRSPSANPGAPGTNGGTSSASGAQVGSSTGSLPPQWDKSVLAQAEASLARHVGPLASVLVRRAARECADLPSLYARLAEQIPDPNARTAFLGKSTAATQAKVTTNPGGSGAWPVSSAPAGPLVNEVLVEQAQRVLAQYVGPIAKVVARKAASRSRDRQAFFAGLAESVAEDSARQKLLAELARLA